MIICGHIAVKVFLIALRIFSIVEEPHFREMLEDILTIHHYIFPANVTENIQADGQRMTFIVGGFFILYLLASLLLFAPLPLVIYLWYALLTAGDCVG